MSSNRSSKAEWPSEPDSASIWLHPYRLGIALVIVLAALTAAHIHVVGRGLEYVGPLRPADHLFNLVLSLAFIALCVAVGRYTLARLHLEFRRPLEELAFASVLGGTALSVLLLVVGLAGLASPFQVSLVVLLCTALVWKEIVRLPKLFSAGIRQIRTHADGRIFAGFAVLVCGLLVVFMFLHAAAPPTAWDSLMYHLEIPRQFLEQGRIFVPEDNLHVAYVGLPHMWTLLFLALNSPSAPAIVSAVFGLILALAVFSAGSRLLDDRTGILSLALLFATPTIFLVAITARVDVTVALYVFLAHYLLCLVVWDEAGLPHLYFAGALLGAAVGVKLHAVAYGIGLAPLILWAAYRRSENLPISARTILVFAVCVAGGAAPWLIKNWILLGAPVYPFLSAPQLPPWLAEIYGSSGIPATVNPAVFGAISQARSTFGFADIPDLFFNPGRLTVEGEGAFYYASPMLIALVLWPLFWKNWRLHWLGLPTLIYLALILVPVRYTNLRYLIPAFIPLTIISVYMVTQVARRFLSSGAMRLLVLGIGIIALFPAGKTVYHWMTERDVLGYAIGRTSVQRYLGRGFAFYRSLTRVVNNSVPKEGKVLLLFEARGYYFEPAVLQDNLLVNWPLLAQAPEHGCLQPVGVTHVLASVLALQYYTIRGMDAGLLNLDKFPEFAEQCLETTYRGGGYVLYRVEPSDSNGAGDSDPSGSRLGPALERDPSVHTRTR